MGTLNSTANKILDIAEKYTQTQGFNAFSYRDIQNDLGIKTSSIHYYFPTKQDLACSMVERHLEKYQLTLESIENQHISAIAKLYLLGEIFIVAAKQGKFCLCGMLSADIATMPKEVKEHLAEFFRLSEVWIARIIQAGKDAKEIRSSVSPDDASAHYLATLEGGMLIARTKKRPEYLSAVISEVLRGLTP